MHNLIINVFGKKGSGKTYFVKTKLIPCFKRVVILDALNEYNYFYCNEITTFVEVLEANLNRNFFRLVYKPQDGQEEKFFKLMYACKNITLVIEETDLFYNAFTQNTNLLKLIKYGRHRNLNLITISRRPSEIGSLLRAQADIVITFQQTLKRDIEYFKFYLDNPEDLTKLKRGQMKVVLGQELYEDLIKKT